MTRRLVPDYPHRIEHLWRRAGTRKLYPRYSETLCPRCDRKVWQHAAGCTANKKGK